MNNNWTNIKIYFIYQQSLALIIIYLMSLHSIKFVPNISVWLILVSFGIVFFWATLYMSRVFTTYNPQYIDLLIDELPP